VNNGVESLAIVGRSYLRRSAWIAACAGMTGKTGFSVDEDGVVTEVTDPENMVLSWDDANPDTNWDDLQITLTGVQEGDDLSTLFGAMPG
jgi:uncharacterized protein YndB with AHSA1/START domain